MGIVLENEGQKHALVLLYRLVREDSYSHLATQSQAGTALAKKMFVAMMSYGQQPDGLLVP